MTDMNNVMAYHDAVKNFAGSKLFFKIFDETIALVQKASDYLEGAGRFDQARLDSKASSLFASESVKMSNRLMHVSSWLLGHRAFLKGDIPEPRELAVNDLLETLNAMPLDKLSNQLPTRFVVLVTQSNLLFDRILRLDEQLKNFLQQPEKQVVESHIHEQLGRLKSELGVQIDMPHLRMKKETVEA